jgi:hypothetical protein
MIADPNNNIPKVYDYWFEDKALRHYKTEKDCIKKANDNHKPRGYKAL